jgi:hypothetical protein
MQGVVGLCSDAAAPHCGHDRAHSVGGSRPQCCTHSVGENPHSEGGFASHCGGFPSQCEGVPSQCDARTPHSVGGIRPQCDDSDLVCHSGLVPPTFLALYRYCSKRTRNGHATWRTQEALLRVYHRSVSPIVSSWKAGRRASKLQLALGFTVCGFARSVDDPSSASNASW